MICRRSRHLSEQSALMPWTQVQGRFTMGVASYRPTPMRNKALFLLALSLTGIVTVTVLSQAYAPYLATRAFVY